MLWENASTNFRGYLQDELLRRCRANPRYSLRAFAKFLDLEPSYLSKLLRGERAITPNNFARLSVKLGIGNSEQDFFFQDAKSVSAQDANFEAIKHDYFEMIADWHHFAILELLNIKDFTFTPKSVARVLGINSIEARDAIQRLLRLELISKGARGGFKLAKPNNTTLSGIDTSQALRKMQRQILERAIQALDEFPAPLRDQTSITFSFDRSLLPQIREKIKKFRRDISRYAESVPNHDEVYQLTTSLFPATRIGELSKGTNHEKTH